MEKNTKGRKRIILVAVVIIAGLALVLGLSSKNQSNKGKGSLQVNAIGHSDVAKVKAEHFEKQDIKDISKRSPLKDSSNAENLDSEPENTEPAASDIVASFKEFKFNLMGEDFDLTKHTATLDILNMGFHFNTESEIVNTVESGQTTFSSLLKNEDGVTLSIRMCNTSKETVTYEASELYGIIVDYYSDNRMPEFYIDEYKAIRLGETTLEEFDELFAGDNTIEAYDATGYSTRQYTVRGSFRYSENYIKLTFSDGVLTRIDIRYI